MAARPLGGGMTTDRIRARIGELDRRELVGLLVVGATIVVAAGLWYVRSLPKPVRIEASHTGGTGGRSSTLVSPSPEASPVVVDVAGWVRQPGVYEMHQGDRVIDALHAAGGAKPGTSPPSISPRCSRTRSRSWSCVEVRDRTGRAGAGLRVGPAERST